VRHTSRPSLSLKGLRSAGADRRTSGDDPPACDQRAEADQVDPDALLTALMPADSPMEGFCCVKDGEIWSEILHKNLKGFGSFGLRGRLAQPPTAFLRDAGNQHEFGCGHRPR
jgi:hypothetical protein